MGRWMIRIERYAACLTDAVFCRTVSMSRAQALDTLHALCPDVASSAYVPDAVMPRPTLALSVIMPAYNCEAWLDKAVTSVLSQKTTYDYELIVVEDGATDRTAEIADAYADDPRVTVIHQENRGFSGARNCGIDVARGEYLLFVDSDDALPAGAIEALMQCAVRENADIVQGNYCLTDETGRKKPASHFANGAVSPLGNIPGFPWGKVIRASLFTQLRFPLSYWFEDSIFSQIIFPRCRSCFTVSDVVYEYFVNSKGISATSKGKVKALDSLYITQAQLKDKVSFALPLTYDDYLYFLRMVALTFHRTMALGRTVRHAVFVMQCFLREEYFSSFAVSDGSSLYFALEQDLKKNRYRSYVKHALLQYLRGNKS